MRNACPLIVIGSPVDNLACHTHSKTSYPSRCRTCFNPNVGYQYHLSLLRNVPKHIENTKWSVGDYSNGMTLHYGAHAAFNKTTVYFARMDMRLQAFVLAMPHCSAFQRNNEHMVKKIGD